MIDIIALGSLAMTTYFGLKGVKSDEIKAELTINRVVVNENELFVNLSVINNNAKPFSIIQIFIDYNQTHYEACRIISVETHEIMKRVGTDLFYFKTHMGKYDFNQKEHCNLDFFNTTAYLLENQAETGWVVFHIPKTINKIDKMGMKISGVDEVIYTFDNH